MDAADYLRTHPPRCLAEFSAQAVKSPEIEFDGHGAPDNSYFAVFCRCGSDRHLVHCFRWVNPDYRNEEVTLSPLDLECAACGKSALLFDSDLHGYDPEVCHDSATARGLGEKTVFACPTCGPQPFAVITRFEYPDIEGNDPEFAGREQDLFTWFSLVGKCAKCSQLTGIADFECA